MLNLEDIKEIRKLDPRNVYDSTLELADQCEQVWKDKDSLNLPKEYENVSNVVLCGMGGSALGGQVVASLFKDTLKVPLEIVNGYHLPAYVNEKSLVIVVSYSGSTEETISSLNEAIVRKAKIVGFATGGKLIDLLKENNLPFLILDPKHNKCNVPRVATGYMIFGAIGILDKIGLLAIEKVTVLNAVDQLRKNLDKIQKEAQEIAKDLYGTIPVIFSSQMFQGNAHIMRNQFNETSKSFSTFSPIPELNHHLMEGLANPKGKKLCILFLTSSLDSDLIKRRTQLTKDVISKNEIKEITYDAHGADKISQMLDFLAFGGFVTLYLGLLYGIDPSINPWVDYFKEQLTK